MKTKLTHQRLMELPVTFSEGVWAELMPMPQYADDVRRYRRIGSLLCKAYTTLVNSADTDKADFWMMVAEPDDQTEFPDEIHLVVRVDWTVDFDFAFIGIMLKDEEATFPLQAPPY